MFGEAGPVVSSLAQVDGAPLLCLALQFILEEEDETGRKEGVGAKKKKAKKLLFLETRRGERGNSTCTGRHRELEMEE